LSGHVPAAIARLTPVERLAATQPMNLAVALPLRNKEALTNLLHDLYDPASPKYHQYLTPEQFTEQFGPTEADYQALIASARSLW
jgi:subtilase family serine protease